MGSAYPLAPHLGTRPQVWCPREPVPQAVIVELSQPLKTTLGLLQELGTEENALVLQTKWCAFLPNGNMKLWWTLSAECNPKHRFLNTQRWFLAGKIEVFSPATPYCKGTELEAIPLHNLAIFLRLLKQTAVMWTPACRCSRNHSPASPDLRSMQSGVLCVTAAPRSHWEPIRTPSWGSGGVRRAICPEKLNCSLMQTCIPRKRVSRQLLEPVEDPGLAAQYLSWVLRASRPHWHDMSESLWNRGQGARTRKKERFYTWQHLYGFWGCSLTCCPSGSVTGQEYAKTSWGKWIKNGEMEQTLIPAARTILAEGINKSVPDFRV